MTTIEYPDGSRDEYDPMTRQWRYVAAPPEPAPAPGVGIGGMGHGRYTATPHYRRRGARSRNKHDHCPKCGGFLDRAGGCNKCSGGMR